jgi:type VI secretion system Hcp family effector
LCLLVLGLSAPPARADFAFARITGSVQGLIQGDHPPVSKLTSAENAIAITSTGFGLLVPPSTPTSPGGKAEISPLALHKTFDRASPKLLRAAFTGEPLLVEVTWFMLLQDGSARQTVTIRLEDALITRIAAAAALQNNDATDSEEVSFLYSRIIFTVPNIDAKGNVTGVTTVCLDVTQAKVC